MQTNNVSTRSLSRHGSHRFVWVSCALLMVGLAAGVLLQRHFSANAAQTLNRSEATSPASKPTDALASLATKVDECLRLSRPVMLGSRDPAGQSCVTVVSRGEVKDAVPNNPGDWNGGPGTTMATLYYFDRQNNKSPLIDFNWHQGRLKTFLTNQAASNRAAEDVAHALAEEALRFSETVNAWTSFPDGIASA